MSTFDPAMSGDGGGMIGVRVMLDGTAQFVAHAQTVQAETRNIGRAAEEADAKAAVAGGESGGLAALGRRFSSMFGSGVSGGAGGLARAGKGIEEVGTKANSAGLFGASGIMRLGGALTNAEGSAGGLYGALAQIGTIAVVATAAAAIAIGAESIKLASKFDSAMSLINTQAHAGAQEIKNVQGGVLSLAGATAQAPEKLAEGLYHIESNGLRGANALSALKSAAQGATTGHADLVDVTNALGAVIAAKLVPGTHDYNAAMGILNATVGAGDMHMQDLAEAMGGGMLATVAGFGVNIKDVGAALATFGDNNIRGANAGTQLRMSVQALSTPAKSGQATLAALGLSSKQLGQDMQHGGLNAAIIDLHNHLDKAGITGDRVGATLTDAFGKRAGTGINVLISQFDRFQSKYADVDKGASKFGADWKATTDQLQFKFNAFKDGVEALGIKIGNVLIPWLEKFATWGLNALKWMGQHRVVLAAIGGVIGAILIPAIVAFMIAAVSAGISILIAWAPFIIVFGGIGAAIYEIATHWGDVKQWAADAFNWIRDNIRRLIVDPALDAFGLVLHAAADAFGWVPGIGGKLKDAAKAFDDFKTSVDASLGDTNAQLKEAVGHVADFNKGMLDAGSNIRELGAVGVGGAQGFTAGGHRVMAAGGLVTRPTLAIVGEAGPEVVLPLRNPNRMAQIMSEASGYAPGYAPVPTTVPMSPLPTVGTSAAVAPMSGPVSTVPATAFAGRAGNGPVVLQLVVDRKVLAEAVYDETNDALARR